MHRFCGTIGLYLAAQIAMGAEVQLPGGQHLEKVDFERHVAPLLNRLGCNSASCHGSFQGKGGFRLSLFGYDPAEDVESIIRGERRVRIDDPDMSLLLRKPSLQVAHGGGKRLETDSWQYRIIREWIVAGAKYHPESRAVRRLAVIPSMIRLELNDDLRHEGKAIDPNVSSTQHVRVLVEFADGTQADVTLFSEFRMQDDAIAVLSGDGLVSARASGDTVVIATYGAHSSTSRVYVPFNMQRTTAWPDLDAVNFIDEHIFGKLEQLRMIPSQLASDTEFLRRITLTTIGQLPTSAEVRSFVADARPDKRVRKIDELLEHELHCAVWATRFSELTGNSIESLEGPDELKPKRAKMWHDWLRRRFKRNTPYDELVRDILTATSHGDGDIENWIDEEVALIYAARDSFDTPYAERPGLDLFWRRNRDGQNYPIEELAERVASSFMGVRIGCARCHKHPFDRWTQQDYRALANTFGQVRFDMSPPLRSALFDRLDERRTRQATGSDVGPPLPRLQDVYLAERPHDLRDAKSGEPLAPKALGGPLLAYELQGGQSTGCCSAVDRRVALMNWLHDPGNPYFARNIVNRVWAHYFGRGLVEPVDGFSAANPPSHPDLLDQLATEFVQQGYDMRRLERLILNSTTWQLSSAPNLTNRADRRNFARAQTRLPPAEAIIDMLHAASGISPDFGPDVPAGIRAVEIAPSRLGGTHWDRPLKLFGRSTRLQTCACDPPQHPSIRQTLALMCDPSLLGDLSAGRLASLLDAEISDNQLLDELFLCTLSREPTEDERGTANQHIATAVHRSTAFEDILWGLINTQEFITNH